MKKISIGILTYNHEHFIEECLRSVLASNYPNLEIIISDDASTDKTREVIDRILSSVKTSHVILFNKNKVNLGLADNFNKTFGELSSGDLFVTLGGDDIIKEDYMEIAMGYFENDSQLMILDFTADIIDETGQRTAAAPILGYDIKYCDLNDYIRIQSIPSFAPGRMIRKELVQNFRPISSNCPTEDSVLVLRGLLMGKFARLNKIVIFYRRHSNNISRTENLRKLSNTLIIAQYLRDSLHALDVHLVSERIFESLLARLNYELKKRDIKYSDLGPLARRFRLMSLYYLTKWKI